MGSKSKLARSPTRKRDPLFYLSSLTIIGFVGADLSSFADCALKARQPRNNNGGKFTELFLTLASAVATQRSRKNTDDE